MTLHEVYNLEFPYCVEILRLNGYVFKKAKNYREALGQLQHLEKYTDEFERTPNYGGHAITAEVSAPSPEPTAKLKWGKQGVTHLDDILLLLSLFTGRHVWKKEGDKVIIVADHRKYMYGTVLLQGLPSLIDNDTVPQADRGFERGVNKVIQHISDQKWIEKYRGGHYLFLADQAFRRQILETQFSLCYTIWEHLFSLHNASWLAPASIHRIGAKDKVAFILSEYKMSTTDCPTSEKIVDARNRVIHFGMFPDTKSKQDAMKFIKATEFLVGKTLGLFQEHSPFLHKDH